MKIAVVHTCTLPAAVEAVLYREFDARRVPMRGNPDFLAQLGTPDALVVAPGDPCTAANLAALPASVKLLASYSVGVDHIDRAAAAARGLPVTNTPDVLTDATADVAMLLLLGAMRGATAAQRLIYTRTWGPWAPDQVFGHDLRGRTLGLHGFGRIAEAVAHRARAFGMHVIAHARSRERADAAGVPFVADLGEFLRRSEVLSLHSPLTAETRGFLNAERIAQLPAGAVVINTGRGELVVDDALIDALRSGRLAAAGLDVFTGEPNPDPRYLELANVFLLPHIGSATAETREAMGMRVVDNLRAFALGKPLPFPV